VTYATAAHEDEQRALEISAENLRTALVRVIDRLQRRNPGAPRGATAAGTLILAGGTRRSPLDMP